MKMNCRITKEDAIRIIREHLKTKLNERNAIGIPEPIVYHDSDTVEFEGFNVEIDFGA